jgi:hypothetical protein
MHHKTLTFGYPATRSLSRKLIEEGDRKYNSTDQFSVTNLNYASLLHS